MEPYARSYPLFSLCGLNCGLCPRFQTEGTSRCPGCGGTNFHLLHPSCAVITCMKRHNLKEYCFECSEYPCPRYQQAFERDSFITYQRVISDLEKARAAGMAVYQAELDQKVTILEELIANYNDGRHKGFYCLAVNLLDIEALRAAKQTADARYPLESERDLRAGFMVEALKSIAATGGVDLRLRH